MRQGNCPRVWKMEGIRHWCRLSPIIWQQIAAHRTITEVIQIYLGNGEKNHTRQFLKINQTFRDCCYDVSFEVQMILAYYICTHKDNTNALWCYVIVVRILQLHSSLLFLICTAPYLNGKSCYSIAIVQSYQSISQSINQTRIYVGRFLHKLMYYVCKIGMTFIVDTSGMSVQCACSFLKPWRSGII